MREIEEIDIIMNVKISIISQIRVGSWLRDKSFIGNVAQEMITISVAEKVFSKHRKMRRAKSA
jgi:hypothetical protein